MLELLRSRTGRVLISGHRGAKGYAPENTLPSFEAAHATGADIVEFDVHPTADGRCVVIHDETLERTTNGTGRVSDHTWPELQTLDAGSWFDRWAEQEQAARNAKLGKYILPDYQPLPLPTRSFAGTRLMLLEEVLEWAKTVNMAVSVEIKVPLPFYATSATLAMYERMVEQVVAIIDHFQYQDRSSIHSFNHQAILKVNSLNPEIATAVSFSGAVFVDMLAIVQAARANGLATAALWINAELVERMHAAGVNIFAWGAGEDPLNEREMLARMLALGVDYLSGGYPDLLREVVTTS